MNLKDFIKTTISEISTAIVESQEELKVKGVIVNPEKVEIGKNNEKLLRSDGSRYIQNLEFDVLINVDETSNSEVKAGIGIKAILKVGAGVNEHNSIAQSNRIRFSIPVAFSTNQTPDEYHSGKGRYVTGPG